MLDSAAEEVHSNLSLPLTILIYKPAGLIAVCVFGIFN